MVWSRSFALALVGATCLAAPGVAQLARVQASPNAPKLLVAPFGRIQAADSDLAMVVSDGLRDRMQLDHTDNFQTIVKKAMCDILVESGFACTTGLETSVIGQLARFANARYIVDGTIYPRSDDSVLVLARLVQPVTNGLATTASALVPRARVDASLGRALADRLSDKFRSFEPITNCRTAREQKNFARAIDQANRALRYDPASGGAFLCLAMVHQDQGDPTDTVQTYLEQAMQADSLNSQIARQLAVIYEQKGDTTALMHMLHHILQVDVTDNDLRVRAARLYVQRGQSDSAIALLNEGLSRNPNQYEMLSAKAISFAAAQKWDSAGATQRLAFEADSTKIDSLGLERITAYYQAAGDTTHYCAWVVRATEHLPTDAAFRYSDVTCKLAHADTAGATTAIQRFMQLAPNDGRGHLVYATLLLAKADSSHKELYDSALAQAEAAGSADSAFHNSASGIILRVGVTVMQGGNLPRADTLLGMAHAWADSGTQIWQTAMFYHGYAQFQEGYGEIQQLQEIYKRFQQKDPTARDQGCAAVTRATGFFNQAEPKLTEHASVNRDAANQLLTYLPQLRQVLTQYGSARAMRCPS